MKGMRFLCVMVIVLGPAIVPVGAEGGQTQPAASQSQPAAPRSETAGPVTTFDPTKSDQKAIAIVDKVVEAMGGAAWDRARFIKFTFVVKRGELRQNIRTHYWDRYAQRSRMEGPSKDGKPVVAIADHRTKEGQATLDGQLLFDKDARKYVDIAYRNLINDSYWLFMQFKLRDPGVRLRYEGEKKAGPVTYDMILVSFDDGVGITSKDRYWLYVNRGTSMIETWSYVLEGQGANASPAAWQWVDWTTVSGMKLALRKTQPEGEAEILLEDVRVFDSLPETAFTSTAPVDTTGAQTAAQ